MDDFLETPNANLMWERFFLETFPDPTVRPEGGFMRSKYLVEHHNEFIKWLDKTYGKQCYYAFTLTSNIQDPTLFKEEEEKMCIAATKILSQQTNPVKEGEAYLEYTDKGVPHIHGWYSTEKGGRIYAKIFKRHWSLWNEDKRIGKGHQGGYHEKQKSSQYSKYASAEGRLIYKVA